MTEAAFRDYLQAGIVLCLVMAVVSTLFRWKRFGPAALALSGAFLMMAALLYGLREGWNQGRIVGVAVVLVVLLAADAMLRSNTDLKK